MFDISERVDFNLIRDDPKKHLRTHTGDFQNNCDVLTL